MTLSIEEEKFSSLRFSMVSFRTRLSRCDSRFERDPGAIVAAAPLTGVPSIRLTLVATTVNMVLILILRKMLWSPEGFLNKQESDFDPFLVQQVDFDLSLTKSRSLKTMKRV